MKEYKEFQIALPRFATGTFAFLYFVFFWFLCFLFLFSLTIFTKSLLYFLSINYIYNLISRFTSILILGCLRDFPLLQVQWHSNILVCWLLPWIQKRHLRASVSIDSSLNPEYMHCSSWQSGIRLYQCESCRKTCNHNLSLHLGNSSADLVST